MQTLRRVFIVLLTAAFAAPCCVFAQSAAGYPTKPLRLVAPYPPGGLNDFLARLLGPKLSEALGQQVLIENRTGAGGMIGTEAVVKAPADGYTVLVASGAEIAINQHLYAKVPYNAEQDLVPVTLVAITPLVLVAHSGVPANTLQELVALAKAKPATLGFASVGDGSSQHLTGEMLMAAAGIRLVHVPYKGAGQSLPDLLGGQIPLGIYGVSTIFPHVKAGKVKVLAVSTPKRSAAVPDWPTMAESGYPGFDTSLWVGLLVRSGTPKEVVDRLNAEAVRILKQPEVVERMAAQGADTVGSSGADFKAFIAAESAKYARIIKQLGIKAS
jgi:tripartite-type tricarboxylate transporter receptor subunit TctC